ncbi:nicotinate phosphoribosyltransferase [Massilia agilis]|uniref:Nicotinate phosphoribosyltransferase n=1 Tax=Massilia agilis TaxID=1811226 RepID=A0ABT2D5Y1_9BURK|nr:nicotinate phosphoribosyltransferase [Massilia agilis]MCS0806722.1 nicotinate phosphoribosyltransferase [Massilia agilis]
MERAASALLTDLYQLTMLQSYHRSGMDAQAVFEFFVRSQGPRSFLVAAGLAQALDYLGTLAVDPVEVEQLRALGRFDPGFLAALAGLRFTGDVDAVPEGTIVFAGEPLLRVRAPLPQAQLVESRLVNLLHYQTMVASKAARCVLAARGKRLVDFGMRRSHGAEAALLAARATWLAGFDGTATLQAGLRFGIPVFGTMAHSFVQAHASEQQAFEAYAGACPEHVTFLIDTYDTEAAARLVAQISPGLERAGAHVEAVRIDSGDLGESARRVRAILDEGGCRHIGIFASGNLEEAQVDALERAGAPIQGYGVGTRMNTSADAPYLDCAYKLVDYAGRPTLKLSSGKATWPGAKQVFRRHGPRGEMLSDLVALEGEQDSGLPLLQPVMRAGRRIDAHGGLPAARALLRTQLDALPAPLRRLDEVAAYPVIVSEALDALARQVRASLNPAPRQPAHG